MDEVYADSAYKSESHDDLLKSRGIANRVLERIYRNNPLTKVQKNKNRNNSATRSIVEHVFGVFKLHDGMANARYQGLARNCTRFAPICLAYNMKRGVAIQQQSLSLDNCQ